ncbi:hypothetical protein PQX77_013049 [Marasmius sp. AFHP31]|nr:hypothetical protein PQX77_013049 [Marasmius sp. AFHP31]
MSVLTSSILGSIKFVGKTRTHFYKAVEVVKTCRELELTIESWGTLSHKAYSTIHKAAENSLSRVVKDANDRNLFQSFVDSVEKNVDQNRWLQFEEKWKAAKLKDDTKERLHKWASERISHAESRKKVELWVSYFAPDEPQGPVFPNGSRQTSTNVSCRMSDSIDGLHWLFIRKFRKNDSVPLCTGSHFYQNLEERVSGLRDNAIDPFAADGTWKPSAPLDYHAITAISSGRRIEDLGSAPLFLLWNRSGEVPLYINTPASQCYRNVWDLGTAVYLLKEQGTGTLVLSTSFIEQFRNSEITAYYANGTAEICHSQKGNPRAYWNDLFKCMHKSPGNWTLIGPPVPCGPSSMPVPEPARRNPQHGSPTTTPPSRLAESVLGDSSLAQRPTMPVPAEPRQRPQQAVPLVPVQPTPLPGWVPTGELSSSSGNTRPPTTSIPSPSPQIPTPATTVAERDVASAPPLEFDLDGLPDTSVQPVMYLGQPRTPPSSLRVMSRSVNSEAQRPTMPMPAKPQQRPWQAAPVSTPLVQPTPLQSSAPARPVSTKPSSPPVNARPPNISFSSLPVLTSDTIAVQRDVASVSPSNRDQPASPAPQNINPKRPGFIRRFWNYMTA